MTDEQNNTKQECAEFQESGACEVCEHLEECRQMEGERNWFCFMLMCREL